MKRQTSPLKNRHPDKVIPKKGFRLQYAALPFQFDGNGELKILLITSRETKRWIIPKGWPMANKLPCQTAQIEAFEEAGILGRIHYEPLGVYHYEKLRIKKTVWCKVSVFPLSVEQQCINWPEKHERTGQWFSLEDAANNVQEKELAEIIRAFNPDYKNTFDENDSFYAQSSLRA